MNTPTRPPGDALLRALLVLVAAAVLGAQWVGVQHRIEHADQVGRTAPAPWHDCAAFDHAALGDGPPAVTPSCAPAPSTTTRVADHSTPASAAPQALGYLSRGPPRA